MNQLLEVFNEQWPVMAPKIVLGLIVLLGFWILGVVVEKITNIIGHRAGVHKQIITLIGRIGRMTLIILGVVCSLGTVGINVSALVASLGLTGFALGFALKDALSNVLAGALILIYRPFAINDAIKVLGHQGTVIDVDLRYTTMQCLDYTVLIPNSSLFSHPVVILNQEEDEPQEASAAV